jgi:hypothetical protein
MELGAAVVREVAKMSSSSSSGVGQQRGSRVSYDAGQNLIFVR